MIVDYLAIALIGFLGGFSHCVGMCGGFVVTYTIKINENDFISKPTFWQKLAPHIYYSLGRLLTYMLLGEIFGLLGSSLGVIFAIRDLQGGLQLFAGLIMIFLGLDLAGWIPSLSPDSFPGLNWFKKLVHSLFNKVNRRNILGLGFILGFIPCGLVYVAGAKAAATESIIGGMLTMFFFGVGTFPAMIITGMVADKISISLRTKLYRLAAIFVLILAALTVLRGLDALGVIRLFELF